VATSTHYRRAVLKVWEGNGVLCDNAYEIDRLQNSGLAVACAQKLSVGRPRTMREVLCLMRHDSFATENPPVSTDPAPIAVLKNAGNPEYDRCRCWPAQLNVNAIGTRGQHDHPIG